MDGIAIGITGWLGVNAAVVLLSIVRAARRERWIRAGAADLLAAAETHLQRAGEPVPEIRRVEARRATRVAS